MPPKKQVTKKTITLKAAKAPAPKTKVIKKEALKKAEPIVAKKASIKDTAVLSRQPSKKDAVAPKLAKSASKKDESISDGKGLDLCLLLDCTGSMAAWI